MQFLDGNLSRKRSHADEGKQAKQKKKFVFLIFILSFF